MTRIEYDLLRHNRPDLGLPRYETAVRYGVPVRRLSHDTLVTARAAQILSAEDERVSRFPLPPLKDPT